MAGPRRKFWSKLPQPLPVFDPKNQYGGHRVYKHRREYRRKRKALGRQVQAFVPTGVLIHWLGWRPHPRARDPLLRKGHIAWKTSAQPHVNWRTYRGPTS